MADQLVIIAGNGQYPLALAQAARAQGVDVRAIAFRGETETAIEDVVNTVEWIEVGALEQLLTVLDGWRIRDVVMAGQVRPAHLFDPATKMDPSMQALLQQVQEVNAETVLGGVLLAIESRGFRCVEAARYLTEQLPDIGVLAGPEPDEALWEDIRVGARAAWTLAELDIGLTVVVKDRAVVAVEALEGTDQTIRRGAAIGRGEIVVVKVARPQQDMRFDLPVIGPETFQVLAETHARALAVEAKKTLLLDQSSCLEAAEQQGLTVVAIDRSLSPLTSSTV